MTDARPEVVDGRKPNETGELIAKAAENIKSRRRRKPAQSDAVLNGHEPAEPTNITMAG